jgi:hypothetical protein
MTTTKARARGNRSQSQEQVRLPSRGYASQLTWQVAQHDSQRSHQPPPCNTGLSMATRKSLYRAMNIFHPTAFPRQQVAILTAWKDGLGRDENTLANYLLTQRLAAYHLSWVPVVGCWTSPATARTDCELSFLVRPKPVGKRPFSNEDFLDVVRELLYNPTNEPTTPKSPPKHCQEAAAVKVPAARWAQPHYASRDWKWAFLVQRNLSSSDPPTGPGSYSTYIFLGDRAWPMSNQINFTQMLFGPRASVGMRAPTDKPTDLGNKRGEPGRRFALTPPVP